MGRWSDWRLLRQRGRGYVAPDYGGPAVYELGTDDGFLVREPQSKYVGETGNLRVRMSQFGINGSNLNLNGIPEPKRLYYRFQRKKDKKSAQKAEREWLNRRDYAWN